MGKSVKNSGTLFRSTQNTQIFSESMDRHSTPLHVICVKWREKKQMKMENFLRTTHWKSLSRILATHCVRTCSFVTLFGKTVGENCTYDCDFRMWLRCARDDSSSQLKLARKRGTPASLFKRLARVRLHLRSARLFRKQVPRRAVSLQNFLLHGNCKNVCRNGKLL